MSTFQWIAYGVAVLVVVGGFSRLPSVWRDEAPSLRQVPMGWPWGPPMWRGLVRAVLCVDLAAALFVIIVPVLLAFPERPSGPFVRPLAVIVPFVVLLSLTMAGALATALWNRPKFLVPPHLREQEGAAVEMWRARRRERARTGR